jgi:hypothetical protein
VVPFITVTTKYKFVLQTIGFEFQKKLKIMERERKKEKKKV